MSRDRGVGEAGGAPAPPPPIFLEMQRVSKEKCLVPPNIESQMVPPSLKVAPQSLVNKE